MSFSGEPVIFVGQMTLFFCCYSFRDFLLGTCSFPAAGHDLSTISTSQSLLSINQEEKDGREAVTSLSSNRFPFSLSFSLSLLRVDFQDQILNDFLNEPQFHLFINFSKKHLLDSESLSTL